MDVDVLIFQLREFIRPPGFLDAGFMSRKDLVSCLQLLSQVVILALDGRATVCVPAMTLVATCETWR